MHISAETLLVEFQPASGNASRIIITDLLNFGMPLIRYQIEDMGIEMDGECACGRGLPRMNISGGRVTDFLITPDNRVISGAAMTIYFIATVPGIAQAQIVQERKDFINLRLVKGREFSDHTLELLEQKVREFFGKAMQFEIDYVEEIPKTASGKYRFSICKLDPMEYLE
jgi:phenylacetate-CoA ligase